MPRRNRPFRYNKQQRAPQTGEPDYLLVGEVLRPHGVRGELSMRVVTEHPERLIKLEQLYLGLDYAPYSIDRIRPHKGKMIVQLAEVESREEADHLRGEQVYIRLEDAVPLEDGEYYLYQIENIAVMTEDGQRLGRLTDYIETGANDVYVITTDDGQELLLPAIPEVIKKVDLHNRVMIVHLLPGLTD
ncbi:MAG: 16S rRNA processing protein RimM [Chloroflexi bacterium]|nr:16S rRNA processing protein RimM [Chloroflexota bacterium]